jgi:hypothetical protein
MILPAIPDIIKDFKITNNASSWILASFLITVRCMKASTLTTPIGVL